MTRMITVTLEEREAMLTARDQLYPAPHHVDSVDVARRHAFADGYRAALAAREPKKEPLSKQAVKAAARAAFDYATESDEYSDRFELWWATYSHEAEELPGDGQRPEAPLTRAVSACCEAWINVEPGGYRCSACGSVCGKVAPVVRDTEREHEPATSLALPSGHEHPSWSRYSYLCGECGEVSYTDDWLAFKYDDEGEHLIPAERDDSDPIIRCPVCKTDHKDSDDDSGVWGGTRKEMCAERKTQVANPIMAEKWIGFWKDRSEYADVLAKALEDFLRPRTLTPRAAEVGVLRGRVWPTLQALGYGKGETA